MDDTSDEPKITPTKGLYVGAPACFVLEIACQQLHRAYDHPDYHMGIYLVGSALERPDWRDVDVRMILQDEYFEQLFPSAVVAQGAWEFDPRWMILTVAVSDWLRKQTGLPIDFQFQPMTHANERHKKRRNALGLIFAKDPTNG